MYLYVAGYKGNVRHNSVWRKCDDGDAKVVAPMTRSAKLERHQLKLCGSSLQGSMLSTSNVAPSPVRCHTSKRHDDIAAAGRPTASGSASRPRRRCRTAGPRGLRTAMAWAWAGFTVALTIKLKLLIASDDARSFRSKTTSAAQPATGSGADRACH